MADDAGQHRECHVAVASNADVAHHQIVKDVDPGAYLGDTFKRGGRQRRGRGAHADFRARQARRAQQRGGAHAPAALLLGDALQAFGRALCVRRASVCHHAHQARATFMQHAADADEHRVVGLDAGAVAVAVDLDHHVEHGVAAGGGHGMCRIDGIHQHREEAAFGAQGLHLHQLARRDAHGVEDVVKACSEELLGFFQGRDSDAARTRRALALRHLNALGRLHMRAQAHAQGIHARLHRRNVAGEALLVEQGGGGGDVAQ